MIISGKAVKFADNVNTDVILPGKYLVLTDPMDMAKHAMEGIDPGFIKKAREGVIIVAETNFGCGSSREHAPLALKYAGVKCVIAESFARIFYRNAINIGLPVFECLGISNEVDEGDELTVDFKNGVIKNLSKNRLFRATQQPDFILDILNDGGLIQNIRKRLSR